ncbi:filamentous hemagglutinin N-terminal domain-containing protein [Cupriavidus gilardii]|uniref:two-partner secretion domain-containing protein n=2 Tax=Cupriavidus gilardii TaxID=82541 RepID=UPI001EE5C9DF|nr:filamentous hemagglutinin N-terminal domain-containing protein [Cupriavidus gilardii]MCG5258655.1 filamentous hemagglutinin N-terminal domain-containing protein [Cupriavidus gilardii]MDF9432535.1 filamentous hemagglutinin N-terminal domain-containing protein [Cupriavidus gilardii]
MNKRNRVVFGQLEQGAVARDVARDGVALHERSSETPATGHRLWQRVLAGGVAVLTWLTPFSISLEQDRRAAGALNAGQRALTDEMWEGLRALTALQVRFGLQAAHATPIVDPNAPIVFRPTITQTTGAGGGVPVLNIAAPNAAGISVNQYQQFNVDPVGLILNNSLMGGTSLTGGQLEANPNLGNRTASTILNEVTSTGTGYATYLRGPLEVFGAPANVIIANPNGIATQGVGFTNTIGVTLSTGRPQFLSAPGGGLTDFANARALAYDVRGGHIQIEGNSGVNGPGAGIEGTVGAIDLIGETVGVNAPLYAGNRINIVAGRQQVATASIGDTGTSYATSANGAANTAAAIVAANGGANRGYAVDATAFGAITAGQIQVIGTAAGMGVRMDGQLAANAGDLDISANGDLTLAATAAQRQATLRSGGSVALSGTQLGVEGYAISADGDVTSSGTLQAGKTLTVDAGRNARIADAQAGGDMNLSAGGSLQAGKLQGGGALSLKAVAGDLHLSNETTATGAVTLDAAGDVTVAAQLGAASVAGKAGRDVNIAAGGTVLGKGGTTIAAGRNVTADGKVSTDGDLGVAAGQNIVVSGQVTAGKQATLSSAGDTTVSGSLASGTATSVNAGGNIGIEGSMLAGTDADLRAGNGLDVSGVLIAQKRGTLEAGRDISGAGSVAFGESGSLTAGNDVALSGKLLSNDLAIRAGNGVSVKDVQAGGALDVAAQGLNGAGDIALNGNVASVGGATLSAQRDVAIGGSLAGGADVAIAAGRNIGVSGNVEAIKSLALSAAGGNITTSGELTAGDKLTANAAGNIALSGDTNVVGDMTLSAGHDVRTTGNTSAKGAGHITAGNDVILGGTNAIAGNATIDAGRDANIAGTLQAKAVDIAGGRSVSLANVQANDSLAVRANGNADGGDITIAGTVEGAGTGTLAAARDIVVDGALKTAGALTTDAGRDTVIAGNLQSNGNVSLQSRGGSLRSTGDIQAGGDLAIDSAQNIALGQKSTTALGHTSLTAGADISLDGKLVGQGDGTLKAGGAIAGGGDTAFGLAAKVSSGGDTNLTGSLRGGTVRAEAGGNTTLHDVQAGSTLTLASGQDMRLTGAIIGGEEVSATAAGNLIVDGGMQSVTGMTLNSTGGSVSSNGTIASQGSLDIGAGTDIRLGGNSTAGGLTTLSAGQDVVVSGVLHGQSDGAVMAARDVAGAGTIAFGNGATVAAGRDVAQDGLIQGQAVQIFGGNAVSVRNVESASTLDIEALGNGGAGDVRIAGTAAASGAARIDAAQDIAVDGKLAAGGAIVMDAQRHVDVAGAVESVGNLSVLARQGNLHATGGLNSGGTLDAIAGQDLTTGASTTAVGAIALTAGRDATLNGTLVGSAQGTIHAGRDVLGGGTQSMTQALKIAADRNIALTGNMQADRIEAIGGNNASLHNVVSSTTLTLAANGSAGEGDAALTGTVGVPGAVNVTGRRDVNVSGALTAGATTQLDAGRDVTVTGSVQSVDDLALRADTGSVTVSGNAVTNGSLSASAGQDINLAGQVSSADKLSAHAGRDIALTGAIAGQRDGELVAGRDVRGNGTAAFANAATVQAGHDTVLTGGLQGATLAVTAGNSAGLGAVQAVSGGLTVHANGAAGGGDIAATGSITAIGDVSLQATRDISAAGAINSGAAGTLSAGRNVAVAGDINTVGDLSVTARDGRVDVAGIATQGDLTLSAGSDLRATGAVASAGSTEIRAARDIALDGGIAGQGAGTISAGGNLSAAAAAFGTQATLTAGRDLTVTGSTATNGALTATAGNSLSLGDAQAGDTIRLTANGTSGGGDVTVGGFTVSGGSTTVTAARDAALNGGVLSYDAVTATAGRNLTVGGPLSANADATLTATTGNLSVTGDTTVVGNLNARSGANLALAGGLINGDTTLSSGNGMTLTGALLGLGSATIDAGGNVVGGGALSFAEDIGIRSGGAIALGSIEGAGKLTATAAGDAAFGKTTVVGDIAVTSSAGSATFAGPVATGGNLTIQAARDVTTGNLSAMGAVNVTGSGGNVSVAGISANGDATVRAGQTLALTGSSTVAGQVDLAGRDVMLSGSLDGSKNVKVAAQQTLDAGRMQVVSAGNTTLSGNHVVVGNAIVGGSLDARATDQLAVTGQQVLVVGGASLHGGNGVSNSGNVLSGGNLTVSGGNVVNNAGASLASTSTTTIQGGSLTNAGVVNGNTTQVSVAGGLTNSGSLMGLNALNITAASLNNGGGLLFAGNPNVANGATGDMSLTLTGGDGSFYNGYGHILAQRDLGISAANMAFDPSQGTISQAGQLRINAGSIYVSGTWNTGGQGVYANGYNGFTNAGRIDGTAPMTLATGGMFTNTGQISAGDLTINGTINNALDAVIHSNSNLTLNGSATNRGTVEAQGTIAVNGGWYDNQLGVTQAAGDIRFNLGGDLQNTGGMITAGRDISIQANRVINDQTAPTGQTTTTTRVDDRQLLLSNVIGTVTVGHYRDQESSEIVESTKTVTLGDLLAPMGANANTADRVAFELTRIAIGVTTDDNNSTIYGDGWKVAPSLRAALPTVLLPEVYQTTTTQQPGTSGVISAGGSISMVANELSNRGGQISAIGGVQLNIQSLANGAVAPTMVNQSIRTVDQGQLTAFLNALNELGRIAYSGDFDSYSGTPPLYNFNLQAPAATSTGTLTSSMPLGLIAAGSNLTISGGNLVNEGILYAGNNVVINAQSLTNQGGTRQDYSTQVGCAAGVPDTSCGTAGRPRGIDPNTTTFSYHEQNASIYAGNDLVIAAGQTSNTYGNLIAGHDIVIGGVGSTAGSTTPAKSLTNNSGNIVAGNNIELNVEGAITNTLPPPVTVHENYGKKEQYAGCMTAGGYKESYCEAYVDYQAGSSSVISAGNKLNINAGSLTNVGSLISAGANAVINVAGPVVNNAQTLNAYWHSHWVQRTGMFRSDKRHDVWACGSAEQCAQLYGSAYTATGGTINPPTPVGNIAATIQAPNLSITSGGQIQNVGNVIGTEVSLTGLKLINGITTANTYTPRVNAPSQVISLTPLTMPGLNLGVPRAVGNGSLPTPVPGKATYIDGQLSPALSAGFGPQILLDNLPATLQPGSTLFYYNPEEENLLLQQAALKQTGKASFIDGLAPDNKQNLSAAQVEKAILYQNALEYAQANGVQLGEALTQAQVNELDKPMLWYVEQTVPDPSCTATGTASCPTITALMPQIYLPADMQAMSAGGNISGHNVTLNFNQDGNGSILNTGTISATGNLSVDTQTLSNQANVVDIGAIWSKVSGGYLKTSGTQVQPGGFMAAAQMDINAERINAVNEAFQIRKADGSIDREASDALVAQLKANLGLNYTSSTVEDDIHQDFVKEKKGLPTFVVMALAVAASVLTAGAAAGAMGFALANMTIGQAMMTAALSSMASSAVSQVASGQGLNFGKLVMAGAVGAATAGLTHGITFDGSSFGLSKWGVPLKGTNTLANLAGTTSVSGVTQAIKEGGSSVLWQQTVGVIGTGLVSAGVNTAVYGGSFGSALLGNLVSQGAALGAHSIGLNLPGIGAPGSDAGTVLANALAHGALGCAAASATGADCAGGAVGAASSAILAPYIRDAIYADSAVVNYSDDKFRQALTVGLAALVGGAAGELAGTDAASAVLAAQNEALNNATSLGPERGISAKVNAYLTKLCEPNCTNEDFVRIDKQVREFEAAVTLERMDNLTPEQALRLGDALSNMIPYFGSPAMLYQAVTGRTLSAQPLETVDRWLSGILGAIPVGAAAYGKLSQLLGRGAGAVDPEALNALVANGVKFTREHVVATTRTPSGQVVFLETGSTTAGLRHIIQEHAKDFANIGVTESQIPGVVMSAIKEGLIVGYQGTGTGRPIYQTVVNGQKQNIAITIGSNGFVVGANPAGRIK